ncbi:MAG TPA: pseudouridine synthase, partial [Candidatus Nitrosotenuis sp.]|nr:pseudouridine synthase [Candidatus Nitrosotenuis sp.]
RPFFAKLMGPKKRNLRLPKKIPLGSITIFSLKQIKKMPAAPVHFVSKTRLLITTEKPISQESLSKLLQLKGTIAIYEKSGKRAEKSIHDVKYKINSENSFYLSLVVDGGVPLKRFVSGEDVFPNVSDILENKSKCETFDFEQVKIN